MSEESKATDLVPVNTPGAAIAEWGVGRKARRYFTSISKDEPDANKRLFQLIQVKGLKIDEFINKEIRIVEYLMSPATFVDADTGEEVTTIMCKLRLADGKVIETHSIGIGNWLQDAAPLIGLPSKKKPYNCDVIRVPCRGTHVMISLQLKE